MAGVFGKDPNMKRSGGREELDRIMEERRRKQALAATLFRQKKPAASANQPAPESKK